MPVPLPFRRGEQVIPVDASPGLTGKEGGDNPV